MFYFMWICVISVICVICVVSCAWTRHCSIGKFIYLFYCKLLFSTCFILCEFVLCFNDTNGEHLHLLTWICCTNMLSSFDEKAFLFIAEGIGFNQRVDVGRLCERSHRVSIQQDEVFLKFHISPEETEFWSSVLPRRAVLLRFHRQRVDVER